MKVRMLCMVLALVALLALAACGGGAKSATFDVEMTEFTFKPNSFTVPAGAPVTLNLENAGTLEHDYVIMLLGKEASVPFNDDDQPNVYWQQKLAAKESATVQFTAPSQPGSYSIVCGIPGHLEQGMKAALTVTEP